jgi:hypothetical protein
MEKTPLPTGWQFPGYTHGPKGCLSIVIIDEHECRYAVTWHVEDYVSMSGRDVAGVNLALDPVVMACALCLASVYDLSPKYSHPPKYLN